MLCYGCSAVARDLLILANNQDTAPRNHRKHKLHSWRWDNGNHRWGEACRDPASSSFESSHGPHRSLQQGQPSGLETKQEHTFLVRLLFTFVTGPFLTCDPVANSEPDMSLASFASQMVKQVTSVHHPGDLEDIVMEKSIGGYRLTTAQIDSHCPIRNAR